MIRILANSYLLSPSLRNDQIIYTKKTGGSLKRKRLQLSNDLALQGSRKSPICYWLRRKGKKRYLK
jgi:hypothetical protein